MDGTRTPAPQKKQTDTTCWSSANESYNARIFIRHCPAPAVEKKKKKYAIWKPSGRLVWGHVIRLRSCCGEAGRGEGGVTRHHNTCFILWNQTGSHNGYLRKERKKEREEWPPSISNLCSVPHQALCDKVQQPPRLWKSSASGIVAAIQRLLHEVYFAKATNELCTL